MAEAIPDLLTIEEAAAVLRIGRTAAYQLARRYLASGGKEGAPGRPRRAAAAGAAGRVGEADRRPDHVAVARPNDGPRRVPRPRDEHRRTNRAARAALAGTSAGQLALLEAD